MSNVGPLDAVKRRAGAFVVDREGISVTAHYGSPAGELAVCIRTVGLADRSDLGKLLVTGAPRAVAEVVPRLTRASLAPGGVWAAGGAWWCSASADRLIVLCEATRRARLLDVVRGEARRVPGLEVSDTSDAWAAMALVGRAARRVLAALSDTHHDDLRSARPFASGTIAGVAVRVLLQSDRRVLLLVDADDADRVWQAAEEAGRAFGLSCVGSEAIERFALLDRMALAAPPVAPR
jgi:glycine cleavage system aminomethyltransferase T